MAAKAWLSILGLYRMNPNLFSEMNLPSGVDETVLQNEIMEECAELEILFPDPAFMQKSLGWWTTSRSQAWEKMAEALAAKYNPIWNKDGTIKETRNYGQYTAQTGAQTISYGKRSAEQLNQVSGYNSDTLVNNNKTETETAAASDTNGARTDTRSAYTDSITRTEQGNIGVTESSAMVQHELDLRKGPTIYDIIVEEFKAKYCLLVY